MRIWSFNVLCFCLTLCGLSAGEINADEVPERSLMFLGGGKKDDFDIIPELQKYRYRVDAAGYEGLTWEKIRQFNIIVLCSFPSGKTDEINKLLYRYLENGGGIFASCGAGQWDRERPPFNAFLKPLNAELPDEQVTDPAHFYRQKEYIKFGFAYTTNVLPSPVSSGVKCIWYPAEHFRADGIKMLFPLKTGPEWQIVIKGMASSYSARSIPNSQNLSKEKGSFRQEPPIMALRNVGAGRFALFPLFPSFTFLGGKCQAWEGIVWDKGACGMKSDTGKLIMNTFEWLAKPSVDSGLLGGYIEPPAVKTVKQKVTVPADVRLKEFPPSLMRSYTGIIGAHSSVSDGRGSIEEFCAAARKACYDFIIFTENLEMMDSGKWKLLKEKCRKESSEGFIAIPGLDYKDSQGNSYIVWGTFDYPDKSVLSADGRTISDTYAFWYRVGGMSKLAITRLKTNPNIPMQLRHYTCCAVYSYKGKNLIDDSLMDFLLLNENFRNIAPLSLRTVYSPDEIPEVASSGFQTRVWARSTVDLEKYLLEQDREIFYDRPHRFYLSSGPSIEYWQGINMISWNDSDFWKFKFHVSSDKEVAEVRILEGRGIYRRFLSKGREFESIIEGFHTNQQSFSLIIYDKNGGMAISPVLPTMVSRQYFCACPDQQNYLSYSWQKNKKGQLTCMTGPVGCQYWGWPPVWNVAVNIDLKDITPPRWDGIHSKYDYSCGPAFHIEGNNAPESGLASTYYLYLASRDLVILDNIINLKHSGEKGLLGDCKPVCRQLPTECINAKVRQTAFAVRTYSPGFTLIEAELEAKKDFTLKIDRKPNIEFISLQRPGNHYLAVRNNDGCKIYPPSPGKENFPLTGSLQLGDYIGWFPEFTGAPALFPLGKLPVVFTLPPNSPSFKIGYFHDKAAVQKGERWTFAFLAMASPSPGSNANIDFDLARKFFGIGTSPAYGVSLKRGEVTGTEYVLKLQAESGGIDGIITQADLPQDLPIMISGISSNISAGLYQKKSHTLRLIPVKENIAYLSLNINNGMQDIYIGNLLECSDKKLVVSLTDWRNGKARIIVHNPTDEDIDAVISSIPEVGLIPRFSRNVFIEKGSSVMLEIDRR